jgi:succinyl-CoA synthetase alpha subunit
MSILVDQNTRLIVQGITGRDGSFHALQMKEYGTNVVAGVTPGKGGQEVSGIPVFNTVAETKKETGANASVIYVPAKFCKNAILESAEAGIPLIICITEGVPVLDMLEVYHKVYQKGITLIGPNCPGVISPGKAKVGIMPGHIHRPGKIGVISRSGTLTYEIVWALTTAGMGQSTCIGVGGDPIIGSNFVDLFKLFEADPDTERIVIVGEIGGSDEDEAAQYFKKYMRKPVYAFIAGKAAPKGKRMGHAGAIVSGKSETAEAKIAVLREAGIKVAERINEVVELIKQT